MKTKPTDPTTPSIEEQLRQQARQFDPALPAGLHRRIISALAEGNIAPANIAPTRRIEILQWWLAAGTLAAALLLAFFLMRTPNPPHHTPAPQIVTSVNLDPVTTANPLALAARYVDHPLQGEVQTLLDEFSTASRTVTHVFPGAARRPIANQKSPTTPGV
jgi:hypothetical protein